MSSEVGRDLITEKIVGGFGLRLTRTRIGQYSFDVQQKAFGKDVGWYFVWVLGFRFWDFWVVGRYYALQIYEKDSESYFELEADNT